MPRAVRVLLTRDKARRIAAEYRRANGRRNLPSVTQGAGASVGL
jgi:hypothetical protein